MIQTLPLKRRAGSADVLPNPWLFPGGHAGAHLSPVSLGNRLRRIGIQPRSMRLAAIDQLAREVPRAMLAGVLGIPVTAAARATGLAGGDWADYAAMSSPQPVPEPRRAP